MEPLRAAFDSQAQSCAMLGSPFMAQLCALLARNLQPGTPLTDRLFSWPGRVDSSGDSVPLRLCGALHMLARQGNARLAKVYPPQVPSDAELWSAVDEVLQSEAGAIDRFIDLPPQTNEIRRSAALLPAALWLVQRFDLPVTLSELGASAGLNLNLDRFAMETPDWRRGADPASLVLRPDWRGPSPPDTRLLVRDRRGTDIAPLDRARDGARLMAYLWPDQPERAALTRAAMALPAPQIDRMDAADWLLGRLADPVPGTIHMIYHTIAWQYFPQATSDRASTLIAAAGARATRHAPIGCFGMESDGTGPGAALTLRLWPGNLVLAMGRADFHGRWIDWQPPD